MMFKRLLICILLPGSLLCLPFLLRPEAEKKSGDSGTADRLVIISAHNKGIRDEYERAFKKYYREHFGKEIVLDFRSPGGTRDIVRYIADRYEAEFRHYYENGQPDRVWNAEIAGAFSNPRFDRDKNTGSNYPICLYLGRLTALEVSL